LRPPLEPPLKAGRNSNQRRTGPTVWICRESAWRSVSVVTISCYRSTAGAQVVVGVRPVKGRRNDIVPDQVFREFVLPLGGHHVRPVIVGTKRGAIGGHECRVVVLAWIAGRRKCMCPAEM